MLIRGSIQFLSGSTSNIRIIILDHSLMQIQVVNIYSTPLLINIHLHISSFFDSVQPGHKAVSTDVSVSWTAVVTITNVSVFRAVVVSFSPCIKY